MRISTSRRPRQRRYHRSNHNHPDVQKGETSMQSIGRAAVMTKARAPLEIWEYPLADVEKGWILVKIKCCAICGSDLHTWLGTRPSPTPIILGHEIMGEIVEMGAGVSRDSGGRPLKLGDRITWTIMDNCGKCYYCREKGLMMKCLDLKKYGHDSCAAPPHFRRRICRVLLRHAGNLRDQNPGRSVG